MALKTNLRSVPAETKKLIKEALSFENEDVARAYGWTLVGEGLYKRVYCKQDVVVKFFIGIGDGCEERYDAEFEFYRNAKKGHKKFFARTYACRPGLTVQKFIQGSRVALYCSSEIHERFVSFSNMVSDKYGLWDIHDENVILNKKTFVVVDYAN